MNYFCVGKSLFDVFLEFSQGILFTIITNKIQILFYPGNNFPEYAYFGYDHQYCKLRVELPQNLFSLLYYYKFKIRKI